MNDLTLRLRQWAINTDATPASDLMEEAASEIDRLGQALKNASNPNALLAAYQLGVRHSAEQSPSGSGSGEQINRSAPERQSPASDRDGGEPLDVPRPDTNGKATGGRGHFDTEMATARLSAANTWLQEEIKRLRLTDAEREAIEQAAMRVECLCQRGAKDMAATLRGLLERTK